MDLRVRSDGSGDAFDRVALRFNGMLDRIQALLDAVRHATDHIAHDLRTPLSRLRTRLESMREVPAIAASPAAIAELDAGLAEADGLLQSFSALLRLSRIEAQPATAGDASVVDLEQLVDDVVELYQPVAAQRGMRLHVVGAPLQVAGDPDQLFQVLVNLLDNALKYGPAGGTVTLTMAAAGGQVELSVRDQGPGIPEGDRQRVFDRFERLQADRGQAGTGLGLSLVRAIVARHRGSVVLSDGDAGPGGSPGLCVTVHLPRRPP
ncbi:MAG: HAMP domain-containing histidine kinase, partial [Stenotrophomonas acidaminiphila]|nr:HAMP domain-containing histidine kinase [Stenotrophomonas acidaminiphila]